MSNRLVKIFLTIGIFSMALCSCDKQEINSEQSKEEPSSEVKQSSSSETSSIDNTIYHTVTFDTKGGSAIENQRIKHGEKTTKPEDPTREGYSFVNWTYNNEEWSFIGYVVTEDITLDANWSANTYTLTLENSIEGAGIFSGAGEHVYDSEVTISATPTSYYDFDGWYDYEDFCVSKDPTYTFYMELDQTITAKWERNREKTLGITPIVNSNNKTVTYGLYPQKNVNDESLIASLNTLTAPESNGWYLYNDEYYAKLSATPHSSFVTFDNGIAIVEGEDYWFKCEPIRWSILSDNKGEYYLLSSVLLDAFSFHNLRSERTINGKTIYPNNYEYSDIRNWLNNDFYNSAFALHNNCVKTTNVDNRAATTGSFSQYACENTQDKVFLPSYRDCLNEDYGFSSSEDETATRECGCTDWTRARGGRYPTSYYWPRSPYADDRGGGENGIWVISASDGHIGRVITDYPGVSVRPAITFKMTK